MVVRQLTTLQQHLTAEAQRVLRALTWALPRIARQRALRRNQVRRLMLDRHASLAPLHYKKTCNHSEHKVGP